MVKVAGKRSIWLLVGVVGLACSPGGGRLATAPESARPERQEGPKRITAAIWGDPQTLNPTINSTGAGGSGGVTETALLLHVGLADVHFTTAVEPRLGERIPSLENRLWKVLPDGRMETTFSIRADARWHDGTPVSADDLAFVVRAGQDREVALLRGANRARYASPELDGLIDRFLITIPRAERIDVLRQMIGHISDQLPLMGIAYVVEAWLFSSRLRNYSAPLNTRNGHLWDLI